jgi:TonB family protein
MAGLPVTGYGSTNRTLNTFSGRVVNAENKPVQGATVLIRSKNIGTVTDEDGKFTVLSPDSTANIDVQSVGFEPVTARLRNNLPDNNILLRQNNSQLKEVVLSGKVAGVSANKRSQKAAAPSGTIENEVHAAPTVGWISFNEYIQRNKKLSPADTAIHGEVVVSFEVNQNGKLSNFRIEKPLTTTANEEAIRLIKQGPSWRPVNGKKSKATVTINF